MNKKLINVLSTSFLIMGLAAGCGVANNEAGNDRDRNNLTPVGYDNNTRYSPLYVTDPAETPIVNNDNADTNDGDDGYSPDPALNQNEANDGDGDEKDTNTDNSNSTTDNGTGAGNNTNDNEQTPGTGTDTGTDTDTNNNDTTPNTETDERTETQTPALGGNATKFADVPDNNPYANDIHAARDLGLLNGTGNNKFGLGSNLTREQMASILMKAYRAGYISANTNNETTGTNNTGTNNTGTNNNNTGTNETGTNNTTGTNNNTGTNATGTNNTGLNGTGQ